MENAFLDIGWDHNFIGQQQTLESLIFFYTKLNKTFKEGICESNLGFQNV